MTVNDVIERWRCCRPDCDDPQCRSMNVLIAEVERLRAKLSVTAEALQRACTPLRSSTRPGCDEWLVCVHLRRAHEAAEAAEEKRCDEKTN
jgi:hypothetical protein